MEKKMLQETFFFLNQKVKGQIQVTPTQDSNPQSEAKEMIL